MHVLQRCESSAHLLARWRVKGNISQMLPPEGCRSSCLVQTCLHVA